MAGSAGRQHVKQQLREIETAALGGMDLALAQIDRVLDALDPVDVRLADFVIADDDRIDGRYLEVHQGVLSLLALQAPVAGDLRLAAAVLHVISNIERIGDQCVNVAKLIPVSCSESPARDAIIERILRMGGLARGELGQARHAFAERDVGLAESIVAQDQEINRLNREVFRLAVQAGEDPDLREWAMTTTLVARAFERIGDNAVAIGEQAIFVATGQFRELASLPSDGWRMSPGRALLRSDLDDLQVRSLAVFDLVLAAIDRVIEALEHQDVELAQIVIDEDEVIDATYVALRHAILLLLALQAPVAGDLRRLAALLHIIRYAERMGAQCVSIAKLIPLSGHEPPRHDEILERVLSMGRHARCEVVQCTRAFADGNVAMAEDLVERDRHVNRLNREIFQLAIDAGDDADTREWAMTMTLVARAFERVGDNAVDVGEQTAFVSTGLFREFADASHPSA